MTNETALKILKERHGKALFSERTALETLIPELKESEDERIRKNCYNPYKATIESIVAMVEKYANNGDLKDFYDNVNIKCKDAMEYDKTFFEKQSEQKPSWSEEDEKMRKKLLFLMEEENSIDSWCGCYEWLQSINKI